MLLKNIVYYKIKLKVAKNIIFVCKILFSEALNDQQDSKTSRSFKTHLKKKKA